VNVVARFVDPIDAAQRRRPWLAFPFAVIKKFNDDGGGDLASMLAFYAFLAIFPLLLVFTTVLGYVLSSTDGLRTRILDSAVVDFPVIGPQLRTNGLHGHWYVLVVSALFSLWGARGVANAAQNAFNTLWSVPIASRPGFPSAIGRSFGLLAVMGVAMIVTGLLSGVGGSTSSVGILVRVLALMASAAVNIGLFVLAFRLATARAIGLREFWLGAVMSAVLWQILLAMGTLLITHELKHSQELYGTFGVVLGLLAWLRLQAQLTLYAIETDVVRVQYLWPRGVAPPPLTTGDRRAYTGYAEASRRRPEPEQNVDVSFSEQPTHDEPQKATRGDESPEPEPDHESGRRDGASTGGGR
jgi:membrane protein